MSIQETYQKLIQRDYSGSPSDQYAQNLETFFHYSFLQGKGDDFFQLLEKAVEQDKKILVNPSFEKEMTNIVYDEIPFEQLILSQ